MKRPTKTEADEIRSLSGMKEKEIDLSDLAEVDDWSKAVVGKFYRPIKTPVTLRLDSDVLAWLKKQGRGYQTRINGVLRVEMERATARRSGKQTK